MAVRQLQVAFIVAAMAFIRPAYSRADRIVHGAVDGPRPLLNPDTILGTWEGVDFKGHRVLRVVLNKNQDGRAALAVPNVEEPALFGPMTARFVGTKVRIVGPGISEPKTSLEIVGTGVGELGNGYFDGTVTIRLPVPKGSADVWKNITFSQATGGSVAAVCEEAKKAAAALSK